MSNEKVVFIDRDGVINVDLLGDYIKSWKEFRFEKGAAEALKTLYERGYQIVIISNQAGIGDGVFSREALDEVQQGMLEDLKKRGVEIRASYYCLHGKKEGCGCRKPKTGLFEQAAKDIRFDCAGTFFIGDKASDVEAGKAFGLKTIFVRTGWGARDEEKLTGNLRPDYIFNSLQDAVEEILL